MNKDTRGQTKGIKTKDMGTHDTHKRLTDTKTVRATSLKVLNCCFTLFHLLKDLLLFLSLFKFSTHFTSQSIR